MSSPPARSPAATSARGRRFDQRGRRADWSTRRLSLGVPRRSKAKWFSPAASKMPPTSTAAASPRGARIPRATGQPLAKPSEYTAEPGKTPQPFVPEVPRLATMLNWVHRARSPTDGDPRWPRSGAGVLADVEALLVDGSSLIESPRADSGKRMDCL